MQHLHFTLRIFSSIIPLGAVSYTHLDEKLHDTDYFYYEVKLRESMKIGDLIKFKTRDFYVYNYEAEYAKGELMYTYRFCRPNGIWQEKIYNKKLSGISLEGTVLETTGEILKLKLNIDEKQDINKAAWFIFTPQTGNIFYSMPVSYTHLQAYRLIKNHSNIRRDKYAKIHIYIGKRFQYG